MIDALREYVIHVIATALICAVVIRLFRGSGSGKMVVKLLCGMVLTFSIIQPVRQMDISFVDEFVWEFRAEADRAVSDGKNASATAWSESIIAGTEAYILEKTKAMNVDLNVEVELSKDEVPMPSGVKLIGKVAPYAKSVLSDMIERDLNIPKECQIWISQ